MIQISRRAFIAAMPFFLGGCVADGASSPQGGLFGAIESGDGRAALDPRGRSIYAGFQDGRFPVPAIDLSQIDPRFYRSTIADPTGQPPGTIVVDPDAHYLYLVGRDGSAIRYGVGVGREGFGWHGTASIRRKAAWPTWTPPSDMVARDEKAARWASGMPGGPNNPLGARALYLYEGDRDTLYRLHGTIEPASIGKSMSSGCIRLLNQDIIDLYGRVGVGTRVVVLPSSGSGETYAEDSGVGYEPTPPDNVGPGPAYGNRDDGGDDNRM